jgi:YbbR domain-containing protein
VNIFRKITHNWYIKLLSLALAAILWVYVNSIQEKERFLTVPVEVRNVSEDYLLSSELPEFVQLVLRGRDESLSLVNEGDVIAYIDLETNLEGETKKIVKVERRGIPRGVSIKEISPRLVDIQLDQAIRKSVKVVPVIVTDLPDGYSFEKFLIEPPAVEIQGPASIIETVESVNTRKVDIANMTETTVLEIELETGSDKITLVRDLPVSIKIFIREEFVLKRVSNVVVYPVNVAEGLIPDLGEQEVSVLIKLPKRLESGFKNDQVYVYVDCVEIGETGDYLLPVTFQSDIEEVALVEADPSTISVHIVEASEETIVEQ